MIGWGEAPKDKSQEPLDKARILKPEIRKGSTKNQKAKSKPVRRGG